MIKFTVNQKTVEADDDIADMPLLWFLRENQNLKGTKFGCGIGQCGACTVHMNGNAIRSCSVPLATLANADITTIEGLASKVGADATTSYQVGSSKQTETLHPVQQAWVEGDVPQCGYCQPGQIMAAAAFLKQNPAPSDQDISEGITNICRCGSYVRIRQAIKNAAKNMS
ncbi:MAG: (2Fe-2S)-binding protein [Alteromonadaceae bacterium]|nr:MAG: (2Fe-2S)-binding protein [Alteromonadaceae bacterium]